MIVLDGGPDAKVPSGSGGPILAGPEAIFVAGRVAADAPTRIRIGAPGSAGELVEAFTGTLATPNRVVRLATVTGDVLVEVIVPARSTALTIFLSDLEEPDEIYVALDARPHP